MDTKPPRPGDGQVAAGQSSQEYMRSTVSAACLGCRSKHLKCDGMNPCSRCSSDRVECVYVRSRRGYKGPRKAIAQRQFLSPSSDQARAPCPMLKFPSYASDSPHQIQNGVGMSPAQGTPIDLSVFDFGEDPASPVTGPVYPQSDFQSRCMEAFFYYFAQAHPFVLPKFNLLKLFKERSLEHVEAAIRYVGSLYIPEAPTVIFEQEAERLVSLPTCPPDGFKVQTLLILAIAFDGCLHRDKALQLLIEAQDLALKLGMDKKEFASANGCGSTIMEESWRRTWWELYVVDGMIAGVHQKSSFRFYDIPCSVPLPCEDAEYISGVSLRMSSSLFLADQACR